MFSSSVIRAAVSLGVVLLMAIPATAQQQQQQQRNHPHQQKQPSPSLAELLKGRQYQRAEELLKSGADVHAAEVDGMTPLHWAVYHDHLDWTRQLVELGADADAVNRYGVTPLVIACENGNVAIVEPLLRAGADPNMKLLGDQTPLMTAARTGVPGVVAALLKHGALVNAQERKGQTAIQWAAAAGNGEVVQILIEAGADYQTPLPSGFTPLFFAVREGRSEVVVRLLGAGVDINTAMQPEKRAAGGPVAGTSPLLLAVENGHFELAELLLKHGADANDQRAGYAPLHAITWVRKPIRGDGDPPPIGSGNRSSLDLVRSLVEHGADVNVLHGKHQPRNSGLNRTDATPFLLAAESGDVPLLKLLLELGADPTRRNVDRVTPLLAACGIGVLSDGDESAGTEEEAIETIELLLELGADINAVDNEGKTAMHGAAFTSWTKVVQLLADRGADIAVWHQANNRGWTPLMIAQGHRPGNFRPSPETIDAIERVMREAGVEPSSPAATTKPSSTDAGGGE